MLVGVPEQIAHVEVVKVDSSNFPGSFFHWRSRVNCGAKAALGEAQNYPPKRAQRLGPTKPSRPHIIHFRINFRAPSNLFRETS
jgi:hypothetical protein